MVGQWLKLTSDGTDSVVSIRARLRCRANEIGPVSGLPEKRDDLYNRVTAGPKRRNNQPAGRCANMCHKMLWVRQLAAGLRTQEKMGTREAVKLIE